jgi:uncharacterized protein
MSIKYKPSFYNLMVSHGPWTLLFNGVTSGLMRLPKDISDDLLPFLGHKKSRDAGEGLREWNYDSFVVEDLPPSIASIFDELVRGRFFVPSNEDESVHLKERYNYYRKNDPFLVTITTTLDCNLGCYYCYENKTKAYLTRQGCDRIYDWVVSKIQTENHKRIYTDWYGGEPMLNQEAIEYFSSRIINYCDANRIEYSSSMISNGTMWPEEAEEFVARTRIRHVQFTLDGPREHHNKRRNYGSAQPSRVGSFDDVIRTIDSLIGTVRIYLRINVDPWVGRDALKLVEFFRERGWFKNGSKLYPYLAMIGPMTEHCGFLGNSEKVNAFKCEFDEINHQFQREIARYIDPRGIQHLQYYPMTVKINCAAIGQNSVIFGPDGLMYKCGLEVGDIEKAHNRLRILESETIPNPAKKKSRLVVLNGSPSYSKDRWENYDPFTHPRCSQCQYLPVCMGGCPKAHFDKNSFYLDQQCAYWENNFDTLIRTYHDTTATKRLQ